MRVCPTCFGLYAPDTVICSQDGAETLHYTEALIGMVLGPYQVRSLISEGGMGVVYAGEHPALGRRVALKVLRPELSLQDPIVERFVQEARAVNTIGHKNIVSVYDFGRTPFGSFYYVMEFLDGQTLRELLERGGALALPRAQFMLDQVTSALAAAHDKGFVHRDVKPENIMLCQRAGAQEFVKLLDFGIAKLLTPQTGNTEQTGSPLGTPQYMSPEQLDDTRVDHRTDIYSLGAVAYEMLTGQVPYGGSKHAAVRQIQLTRTPPPPSVCRRDVILARSLDAAVLAAINLDPDARFTTVQDFNAAFRAGVEDTVYGRNVSQAAGSSGRLRGILLAVLVAIVLAGVGAWVLLRARTLELPDAPADAATRRDASPQPTAPVREQVAQALAAADPALRERAVIYLGRLRRRSMEPALRKALDDEDPRVCRQAALALGNLGKVSAETTAALHRALDRYARRVANPWLRVDVAGGLALLQDPVGIGALKRDLTTAKGMLRTKALEALAAAGQPAGAALADHVTDTIPQTRFRRLGHLAKGKHAAGLAARRTLAAALGRGTWEERILAAAALASTAPDQARKALVRAVESAPPDMRVQAAIALAAQLEDARSVPVLLESLGSTNERQGPGVALGLGVFADARVTAALRGVLARGSPAVRLAAAVALLER